MDYGQALDWMNQQEGGSEYVEAVRAYVKVLSDEAKKHKLTARDAEAKLKRYSELAGEGEDLEKVIQGLKTQLAELTKERDDLKTQHDTVVSERDALKTEKTNLERGAVFRTISDRFNFDYSAFESLFKDTDTGAFNVSEDSIKITVDGKEVLLEEYVESLEEWKKNALSYKNKASQNSSTSLPSAGTKGTTSQGGSLADNYLNSRVSASRFKKS
ncbi:MAG: hypothetical protein KME49_13515 [Brasilonema octagenarum HA4186-MV1]|jgi:purine nucleoside permease|nr:hypothetical protein [Brasilonema octagenarum HA4186-MV1]